MGKLRIGMICRADNSGLGTLSREFADNLKPSKVLIVQNGVFQIFPERYHSFDYRIVASNRTITPDLMEWLLKDIDILVSFETFYNWTIVTKARNLGVKTVLVTMFEMTPVKLDETPDLFLCPSELDYKVMPEPKAYLPIPMNTMKLEWKKRTKANVFIHTASHGGMNLRKGTPHLLEAMKYVKSDIKLIIYSWLKFETKDPRIEIKMQNFKDYWQIWRTGDVLIYPQDYNGICLPICEAMASGLGVITTDIYPFNEYFPKDLLFAHSGLYPTCAAKGLLPVEAARIDPKILAEKIDEVASKDISEYSLYGKEWAEKNSWKKLKNKYLKLFENIWTSVK